MQLVAFSYRRLRTCLVSFKNYLQEGQYNHLKTAVKGTFTVFPKSPTFV
ncbi:ImpB/MucB/SamB family protein [Lacticaseibacillus paracasei]|nr:ImpB/MucB/SamB family protein [Lacticaseibacillus paracasei]